MDGYITIGTKIDSNNLEDDYKRLKKELSKYERESETLLKQKTKLELDTADAENKVEELHKKIDEIYSEKASVTAHKNQTSLLGNPTFRYEERENILTNQAEAYKNEQDKILETIRKQDEELAKINGRLQNNVKQQQILRSELTGVNNELRQQSAYDTISKKISGIVGKVAKWGLALFGIRGAYSMISRAMSTLSQQDKNMASQIQYIQWTLAQAIAPVVKFIINAVKLILDYINAIWRILFGHDLFKGPKEFASSMKSASGSAQKIQKSLAGFDEMNILGDNTATAGGVSSPTFDFNTEDVTKGLEKVEKKVKELKKTYIESTDDMGRALSDPEAFKRAYGNWDWLMMGIVKIVHGINTVVRGIGDVFGGLFQVIHGLFTGNIEEILGGFIRMGEGIAEIFRGLFEMVDGIFMTIAGVVKGVVLDIIDFFSRNWGKISEIASNVWKSIKSIFSKKNGKSMGADFSNAFSNAFKSAINWVIDKLNWFVKQMNKINIKLPGGESLFKVNIKPIPKLAKGTILNNPGRGVPIGNAIAGERGREAVLPLSDSQLLEELGSTIGRYITINLTNETKLDGRTIARKVNQLSNNDNFLRNR